MEVKTLLNLVYLKDLILKFLESKDILKEIEQVYDSQLKRDQEKQKLPIIFTLKITYKEIVFSKDLLHFITKETDFFLEIVQEVIELLLKTYFETNCGRNSLLINYGEILCNFHFFELPLDLYKFSLRHNHINVSLSTFRCVVHRIEPIVKYIRQSVWKCDNCFNSPLIIEKNRAATHKSPKCKRCLKPCIEITTSRVTSDFCAVFVFESEYLFNLRDYFTIRALELRLFGTENWTRIHCNWKIRGFQQILQRVQHLASSIMSSSRDEDFFDCESQNIFSHRKSQDISTFFSSHPTSFKSQLHSRSSILFSQFDESTSHQYLPNTSNNTNNSSILFSDSDKQTDFDNPPTYSPSSQNSPEKTQIYHSVIDTTNYDPVLDNTLALPNSVTKIYSELKKDFSDFTFTSVMAGQLCTKIFPFGAYNNLKMSLLMSLVTSPDKQLHIMAIGHEESHANIIMNHVGKFAHQFLRISSTDGVIVKNNNVIECGPILLASNGIAFLGNWQAIQQKSSLKLLREIETKTVLADKIQKHYPLQTTFWTYWNYTMKMKKDLASISQFINIFGIGIIIDDEIFSEDIIDDLLNQVLTEPFDRSCDYDIPDSDFRMYINYARNLSVEFNTAAENMLKNYFMATKMIRSDALSEKGLETLKILAASHAKLSLRNVVGRQDVLVAISIAEKFIKEFFETDAFSSPSFDIQGDSIECFDKFLSGLYEWYLKFTSDILEK